MITPKAPMISICIPTFNRADKLYSLVNNVLEFNSNEIEVVVLDNLSTDHTIELLDSIKDTRFRFIQNKSNIGGPFNLLKVLTLAKGEYSFLCLDKDSIDHKNIGELINRIQSDKEVVFGYCALNAYKYECDISYRKGYSSVYNLSYLSRHPTGMFYKTEIYKEMEILRHIFSGEAKFGFYTDLINAEISFFGKSKIINLPLFYTETKEDCALTPSFTYIASKEVFFSPLKRYDEFLTYAKSASHLNLSINQKNRLIKKLFEKGLVASTLGYRDILMDPLICTHYLMIPERTSIYELIKIDFKFSSKFLKSSLPVNQLVKIYICIFANLKLVYAMFLRR